MRKCVPESSKIRYVYARRCKAMARINLLKWIEKSFEIRDLCAKGGPKSTKMVPRSAPKAILEASRFWEPQKVPTPRPFGYHLGDLGRHFGHHWAPRDPKIKRFGTILGTTGRQHLKT